MATIDLGRIKFKWQGAYNGATAYVVDDVVESGGSAYVCIAATTGNTPPNATYWELMAQKGVDADLFSISGTVQGDIYYNNGSAIARLGAGTAGQALITNGTGANPSWGSVAGGKILQVVSAFHTPQASTTSTSFQDLSTTTNVSITPSATSSKILILAQWNELYYSGNTSFYLRITRGGTEIIQGHNTYFPTLSGEKLISANQIFVDSPSTTSATQYKMQFRSQNSTPVYINQNGATGGSGIILMEIGA